MLREGAPSPPNSNVIGATRYADIEVTLFMDRECYGVSCR